MSKNEPNLYEIAIRTTSAPSLDAPPALALLDALQEIGCSIADTPKAIELIETALDTAGAARGAEALHRLLQNLEGKKGLEIKLALTASWEKTMESYAQELGISRQTLEKNVERARARIFPQKANKNDDFEKNVCALAPY